MTAPTISLAVMELPCGCRLEVQDHGGRRVVAMCEEAGELKAAVHEATQREERPLGAARLLLLKSFRSYADNVPMPLTQTKRDNPLMRHYFRVHRLQAVASDRPFVHLELAEPGRLLGLDLRETSGEAALAWEENARGEHIPPADGARRPWGPHQRTP